MIMHSTPRLLPLLLSSVPLLGALGCQPAEPVDTSASETKVVAKQAIGESVRPIWTKPEVGLGIQPSYRERLLTQAANRLRMTPQYWSLRDGGQRTAIVRTNEEEAMAPTMPMDMRTRVYAPAPPARYSPYMSDTSRWQAEHMLLTGCSCTAAGLDDDGNPMTSLPPERDVLVNASCCKIELVEGKPECVTGAVPCVPEGNMPEDAQRLASRLTTRADRWALLNKGVGRIIDEVPYDIKNPEDVWRFSGILNAFIPSRGTTFESPLLRLGANTQEGSVMGYGLVSIRQPPANCLDLPAPCGAEGACTKTGTNVTICDTVADPNDDCLGLCVGGPDDGEPCKRLVPKGKDCDPATYPTIDQIIYTKGAAVNLPAPMLSDGLHMQLGLFKEGMDMMKSLQLVAPGPSGPGTPFPFGQTARDNITFGINYYGPNGTPIGTPTELKLVLKNACVDLVKTEVPQILLNRVSQFVDAPYGGNYFSTDQPLTDGCYPYVFAAIDGDGFGATYPTYGALQARVETQQVLDPDGLAVTTAIILEPDDTCPIWTEARPDLSCATSPQECTDGDTRSCYTGLIGTQDNGICKVGTETCKGGRWEGFCAGQVLPAADDVCGDGLDNNCNGTFDDNCPNKMQPDMAMPPKEDMSTAQEDMGQAQEDMKAPPEVDMAKPPEADMKTPEKDMTTPTPAADMAVVTTRSGDGGDDGCGCQSTNRSPAEQGLPLGLGLLGLVMLRRRQR